MKVYFDGIISATYLNGQQTSFIICGFVQIRRRKLSNLELIAILPLSGTEDYFIIDSMPLEVCKLSRYTRSTICKEQIETTPNKGFCAAQNLHFYGYKLYAMCTLDEVFTYVDLSVASVHDIHFLKDIKSQIKNCIIWR